MFLLERVSVSECYVPIRKSACELGVMHILIGLIDRCMDCFHFIFPFLFSISVSFFFMCL